MVFNEIWYSREQLEEVAKVYEQVRFRSGLVVEMGCWEGVSSTFIANLCHPDIFHAVDTWHGCPEDRVTCNQLGQLDDMSKEPRNVLATFKANMDELTQGNYKIHKMDNIEFAGRVAQPIKFCHIDAAHFYKPVRRAIDLLKPKVVPGGILCGDDYIHAHKDRHDLQGGVEQACIDALPGHKSVKNVWYWVKPWEVGHLLEHGELDNTIPDLVTGYLKFEGRDRIELRL